MTTLRVTQTRSKIGIKPKQRGTLRALGLKRINHTVEHQDQRITLNGIQNSIKTAFGCHIAANKPGNYPLMPLLPGQTIQFFFGYFLNLYR